MELTDLVNSVYNYSISNDLTQIVNFPTWIPDSDCHSPALLDLFLFSGYSICSMMAFPQLKNSDHVIFSVSIGFPIISEQDALFHLVAILVDFSAGKTQLVLFEWLNNTGAIDVKMDGSVFEEK